MIITRRAFTAALSLTGLAALAGLSPLRLISSAMAQSASDVAKPVSLPDMALGPANASVTITEYASMTCPHCANFAINTFPTLKEKYIDTGKVRFIFREFPFDPVAAGAFMLARCAGNDKFFAVIDLLFHTQSTWAFEKKPLQPLLQTLKQTGFTEESFKACLANQKMLDGVEWVRNRGAEKFKVDSTPTFFINGQIQKGALSFEDMEKVIQPLLKT